jgi:hypothetical protein
MTKRSHADVDETRILRVDPTYTCTLPPNATDPTDKQRLTLIHQYLTREMPFVPPDRHQHPLEAAATSPLQITMTPIDDAERSGWDVLASLPFGTFVTEKTLDDVRCFAPERIDRIQWRPTYGRRLEFALFLGASQKPPLRAPPRIAYVLVRRGDEHDNNGGLLESLAKRFRSEQ